MFENTPLNFLYAGVGLYLLGFGYAMAMAVQGKEHDRPVFYTLIVAGFLAQSRGLYFRGLETHSLPVGNAFELVQALAWVAVFVKLILRVTLRLRLLGLFATGLAAGLGVVSLFLPSARVQAAGVAGSANPWIEFHVALAVFSYGVFGLLAVTALMYLIQRYGLEHKRFTGIFRLLPSLAELDALNQKLLLVGAWALSVAVGLGVLDWLQAPGSAQPSFVAKLVVTIAVWVGYLVIAWLRWRNKLVGRAYAWSCLAMFALAIFSLWPVSAGQHTGTPAPEAAPKTSTSKRPD